MEDWSCGGSRYSMPACYPGKHQQQFYSNGESTENTWRSSGLGEDVDPSHGSCRRPVCVSRGSAVCGSIPRSLDACGGVSQGSAQCPEIIRSPNGTGNRSTLYGAGFTLTTSADAAAFSQEQCGCQGAMSAGGANVNQKSWSTNHNESRENQQFAYRRRESAADSKCHPSLNGSFPNDDVIYQNMRHNNNNNNYGAMSCGEQMPYYNRHQHSTQQGGIPPPPQLIQGPPPPPQLIQEPPPTPQLMQGHASSYRGRQISPVDKFEKQGGIQQNFDMKSRSQNNLMFGSDSYNHGSTVYPNHGNSAHAQYRNRSYYSDQTSSISDSWSLRNSDCSRSNGFPPSMMGHHYASQHHMTLSPSSNQFVSMQARETTAYSADDLTYKNRSQNCPTSDLARGSWSQADSSTNFVGYERQQHPIMIAPDSSMVDERLRNGSVGSSTNSLMMLSNEHSLNDVVTKKKKVPTATLR